MSDDAAPDFSFLISTSDLRKVVENAVAEDRKHRSRGLRTIRMGPFQRQHGITETEWRVLVANAEYPNQQTAANALGINLQTFKNHMTSAKRRKQASSQLDLYFRMGWLFLPEFPSDRPPVDDIPDTMLVRGHMVVHVAACECRNGT